MVPKLPKSKQKTSASELNAELTQEYQYASHHHLIPLYVLAGVSIVALLVLGCILAALWQVNQRESFRPAASSAIANIENRYLPTVVQPTEKKQYIYSATVRFPITDPYTTLRYSYEAGVPQTKTSAILTLTTSPTLQTLEAPLLKSPDKVNSYTATLEQCARLYIVRFEPGLVQYGGFAPLKDVKLKDGRTAYIFKNTDCVPSSVQAMDQLETVESDIQGIESY